MNVKMCSMVALAALLAASVLQAADSSSNDYHGPSVGSPPRLLPTSAGSAGELGPPSFDEIVGTATANSQQLAPRPTRAESVLVANAETGPVDPEEPKLAPAAPVKRSATTRTSAPTAGAALTPRSSAPRSSAKPATPASYNAARYAPSNAARYAPSAAPRTLPTVSPRAVQSQHSTPTYPSSYAATFSADHVDQPANGGVVTATPEAISSGDYSPLRNGNCATCNNANCGDCGDCGGDPGWMGIYNCCGWFGGADFLYLRPTFSENTAYIERTTTLVEEPDREILTLTDQVVNHDWDYNGGVRAFLGYRFCDCGGELRFTYWNITNDAQQASGRATEDGSVIYFAPLEIVTLVPGERLLIDSSLNMNLYDIEYAKCLSYGGCDPCDPCNSCPLWSLKYFAGVRIADVRRQNNIFKESGDDNGVQAGFITGDFIGAGPRVGLEGRRYFGAGRTSLFARSNFSLLLGEFETIQTRKSPPSFPTLTENYFDTHSRIIPVAEIEIGGNWQMTRNTNLAAGYMFQAWWDLGASEQIQGNVFLTTLDDANIMGLDGLFARFEFCF